MLLSSYQRMACTTVTIVSNGGISNSQAYSSIIGFSIYIGVACCVKKQNSKDNQE